MKISDEICELADESGIYSNARMKLRKLADRIDSEMVELPKDADGVPIHVGDTVYMPSGNTANVTRVCFHVMCSFNGGIPTSFPPYDLTHSNHDTLERIADDIEACKSDVIIDSSSLSNLAKRIRRLAKKGE